MACQGKMFLKGCYESQDLNEEKKHPAKDTQVVGSRGGKIKSLKPEEDKVNYCVCSTASKRLDDWHYYQNQHQKHV